jgi:hypothetical protein
MFSILGINEVFLGIVKNILDKPTMFDPSKNMLNDYSDLGDELVEKLIGSNKSRDRDSIVPLIQVSGAKLGLKIKR